MTIVGKNEIYNREHLVGPFLVHKLLGPLPPFEYFPGPVCPLASLTSACFRKGDMGRSIFDLGHLASKTSLMCTHVFCAALFPRSQL